VSLLDFPDEISSIIFLGGCNFRCPFCQNGSLVTDLADLEPIPTDIIFKKIEERKNFITGVVITGGEPLIHDYVLEIAERIKNLGLLVKVDTNGSLPDMLKRVVSSNLVDYISMDIKTSFSKYSQLADIENISDRIKESINILKSSNIKYEFRTTCVPKFVNSDIIKEICLYIQENISCNEDAKSDIPYFLQQFRPENAMSDDFQTLLPYGPEEMKQLAQTAKQYIKTVGVRGV